MHELKSAEQILLHSFDSKLSWVFHLSGFLALAVSENNVSFYPSIPFIFAIRLEQKSFTRMIETCGFEVFRRQEPGISLNGVRQPV